MGTVCISLVVWTSCFDFSSVVVAASMRSSMNLLSLRSLTRLPFLFFGFYLPLLSCPVLSYCEGAWSIVWTHLQSYLSQPNPVQLVYGADCLSQCMYICIYF